MVGMMIGLTSLQLLTNYKVNIRKSYMMPDECSVFQVEIFAIIKATDLYIESNI